MTLDCDDGFASRNGEHRKGILGGKRNRNGRGLRLCKSGGLRLRDFQHPGIMGQHACRG